jgi:hypothetical protein
MTDTEFLAAFVAYRDLWHCACNLSSPPESKDQCRARLAVLERQAPRIAAGFAAQFLQTMRSRSREQWHALCQTADRLMPLAAQGAQARRLGVPRDAAIHSTLDDGTDAITLWLAGWDGDPVTPMS